jgi:enoyl-CoA hydratase
MPQPDLVRFEHRDRIALITLERPQALNALDDALNSELRAAWLAFRDDAGLDVAVLTGAGRAFCAGADLKSFIPAWERADAGRARRNAEADGIAGGITRGLHRIDKPIIAAVNGPAFGGGFELALACDLRIASEQARFAVLETRFGLHQGDGGLVRLLSIAGLGTALELTLTGREIDAQEALRLQLVSQVVPAEQLLPRALEMAAAIGARSQTALRSAKRTLLDHIGRGLDEALRAEAMNAYSCLGDFSEARERLRSFIEGGRR